MSRAHTYDAIPDNDLYKKYIVVITGDVYVYLPESVCTLNWGGWVLEMPNRVNWVPSGALNDRWRHAPSES